MSDYRNIADGLFPNGMDPANLTEIGRAEARAAVEALLRIYERDNARLALALEQLDRGAAVIERLRALVQCLLDEDPNDLAADGGVTVLDVWRKEASRALAGEQEKGRR